MDIPWGLLLVVLYPALQVPALFYLARRYDGDWEPSHEPTEGYNMHPNSESRSAEVRVTSEARDSQCVKLAGDSLRVCDQCGAANGIGFTYCQNCSGRIDVPPW